jgi:putative ABC transport system ATP-binding protein
MTFGQVGDSTIVACEGITRRYGAGVRSLIAVNDASLTVARGEFVAIQGPSGSGKSTLLGIIAGIEDPDAGTVRVLGQEMNRLAQAARARLRRQNIGIVLQSFGLLPSLSVLQNVLLPLALDDVPQAEQQRRGTFALLDVGLADRGESRIDDLSGGERQRVAIARALVGDPALVLADEPTGQLDEATGASVLGLLAAAARDRGAALILVTHDPASASRADREYAMLDGRLTEVER